MMDDLIPHPFASILFALVVGALFLWQGFEENRPAKRSAQSLSRPAIPTEKLQAARLSQHIQSVPLRGEADIQPKPTKKIYYRVIVPDSGTLEAGDVVIKLNGIVASKADAQCHDKQGKNWPCGAAAKTALRRLIRARAVVCDLPEPGEQKSFTARCAVSGTDLSTWMVRQGWAKPNDPPEPALADAAEAAKSERIGLWQEPIMVR
jgi:endonuclease YncB( thermonuclease family)